MDLKALIAKMDHIESKKILNEGFPTVADAKARADKEKTTGKFDKKEIKPGVTQYTRKSSTFDDGGKDSDQKKAEKKKKNEGIEFQSSIAQALLREFGLEEKITLPADGSTPAIQQVQTPAGTVTQAAPAIKNPYQGADAAKFAAMSPEDQAWLTKGGGQPDINDQFILARAPNKGKAVAAPAAAAPAVQKVDPNQADRDDAEMGAAMRANAAGGNSTSAATGVGNPGEEAAAQAAAAQAAAPATAQPPAGGAGGPDAVAATRKRMQELLDKLEKTGGVSGAPAAPAAKPPVGGKPAAPAPGFANTGGGAATGNPNIAKQGAAAGAVREASEDNYILSLIRAK